MKVIKTSSEDGAPISGVEFELYKGEVTGSTTLEQLGNPFMVVLGDVEGRTAIDWGVTAAPETFLVDGSGIVRWKYSGAMTQRVVDEKLIPALEKIEKAQGNAGSTLHTAP